MIARDTTRIADLARCSNSKQSMQKSCTAWFATSNRDASLRFAGTECALNSLTALALQIGSGSSTKIAIEVNRRSSHAIVWLALTEQSLQALNLNGGAFSFLAIDPDPRLAVKQCALSSCAWHWFSQFPRSLGAVQEADPAHVHVVKDIVQVSHSQAVCFGHCIVSARLQNVPLSEFAKLGENDILFIDSSHLFQLNGDVS